jgi:hypothetical protein
VLLLCLVVLAFAVNLVAGLVSPDEWAVEAATAACRERGLQLDTVNASQSKVQGNLLGRTAEVHLKGKQQERPASVRVTLRKALNILGWQVVAVQEEPG